MNKVINKYLLTGDKSIPEFDLKQSGLVDHLLNITKKKKLEKQAI